MAPRRHRFHGTDTPGVMQCCYCDVLRRAKRDGRRGGRRIWYRPWGGNWTLKTQACFVRPLTAAERRTEAQAKAEILDSK